MSYDHYPQRPGLQEPLLALRNLVEPLTLELLQNSQTREPKLIAQVTRDGTNSLMAIDNLELSVMGFRKIEWWNRNIQKQRFNQSACAAVIPDIISLEFLGIPSKSEVHCSRRVLILQIIGLGVDLPLGRWKINWLVTFGFF